MSQSSPLPEKLYLSPSTQPLIKNTKVTNSKICFNSIPHEVEVSNEVEQQFAGKIKYIGDNKAPETIDYKIEYNN